MNNTINLEVLDYWKQYSISFIDELKSSPTFNINTIHVIIIQILDEIQFNNFKSKENKEYFKRMIGKNLKSDFVAKEIFNDRLNKIIQKIDNSEVNFLNGICKEIKRQFDNGDYYIKVCNNFINLFLVKNFSDDVKDKIKFLGKSLILELVLQGDDIENIKNIIKNLNKKITENSVQFIEDYLKDIFIVEKRIVIFQIAGLRGKCDVKFGNINIYSPYVKTYINKDKLESYNKNIEYYNNDERDRKLNIAILMEKPKGYNYWNEAIKIASKVFNFLEVYLEYSEDMKIEIESKSLLLVDYDGNLVDKCLDIHDEDKKIYVCKDIDTGKYKEINRCKMLGELLFGESNTKIEEKLKFSLYWYIKAVKNINVEEKLLYCWISLEKLFELDDNFEIEFMHKKDKYGKNEVISKIVAPIIALSQPKEKLFELSGLLGKLFYNNLQNQKIINGLQKLSIKEEQEGKYEYLCRLLNEIDEIRCYLNIIQNELIENIKRFYYEKEYANEKLLNLKNNIENDILNIYKLRNRIVHNAFFTDDLINHYCIQCMKYTSMILNKITDIYNNKGYDKIEDIIISINTEYEILVEKIKNSDMIKAIDESYFN